MSKGQFPILDVDLVLSNHRFSMTAHTIRIEYITYNRIGDGVEQLGYDEIFRRKRLICRRHIDQASFVQDIGSRVADPLIYWRCRNWIGRIFARNRQLTIMISISIVCIRRANESILKCVAFTEHLGILTAEKPLFHACFYAGSQSQYQSMILADDP